MRREVALQSSKFSEQYDRLKLRYPRLRDVYIAVEDAALLSAEDFWATGNPDEQYRYHRTQPDGSGTPAFRFLFKIIDANTIEFVKLGVGEEIEPSL